MALALRRLSIETYIIALIAMVDLVLTINLVQSERAYEGNPIMNFYLGHGIPMLILMKSMMTALPLLILEYAKHHRPDFVKKWSRLAICAYLGVYGFMFVKVNLPTLMAEQHPDYHWQMAKELPPGYGT